MHFLLHIDYLDREIWGLQKKVVKITTGEKILEVAEDPVDQITAWWQVLGDKHIPWLLDQRPHTSQTGTCEQWHSITWLGFVPVLPWPAATSLCGGTLRPGKHSAGGEGEDECVRKSSRAKA